MLSEHGLEPLTLQPKEGLSLVNGTEPMQALLAFSVHDATMLVQAADVASYARNVITTELGAVVDNPVIVPDGEVMTTGNFHGEPLAFAADMLAMAQPPTPPNPRRPPFCANGA